MKHLISLSFKYIRNQKLRSTLTFLCITLAVFIMNTFSAYVSSVRATMVEKIIREEGGWEVMIADLLAATPDHEKAVDIISSHAAVSAYSCEEMIKYHSYSSRNEDGYLPYFSVRLDDQEALAVYSITQKLCNSGSVDENYPDFENKKISADSAYVPVWFMDYGYEIGDTVTITITPVMAQLDEDSPQVQAMYQFLAEKTVPGTYLPYVDDGNSLPDEETLQDYPSICSNSLLGFLREQFSDNEIPFCNEQYGKAYTFTVTIEDFLYGQSDTDYFCIETSFASNVDLKSLHDENLEFMPEEQCAYWPESIASIRVKDHIDFEEGLMALLLDLGFEKKDYYTYFPQSSEQIFHQELLGYEMKSAYAITFMLPVIILVLGLTLLVWAISRFVIDNAFEISVKERVNQFAVLRIMGASRGQMLALVFTEAVFYCLTALPIGIFTAFGLCKLVFSTLHNSGFSYFTFHADPLVTFIGIFLCVAGICISAYTSAMWAARKLSPLEALNYGAPKKKKRHMKPRRKSYLNLGAGRLIVNYTMRNIGQNKNRFLISSIAMALGVTMFTFCTLVYLFVGQMIRYEQNAMNESYDFEINLELSEEDSSVLSDQYFLNNTDFSDYYLYRHTYISMEDNTMEIINSLLPETVTYFNENVILVSRSEYDRYLGGITGFSFDEFVSMQQALLYYSPYGRYSPESEMDVVQERKYSDSYSPLSAVDLVTETGNTIPVAGMVCVEHPRWNFEMGALIVPFECSVSMLPEEDSIFIGGSCIFLTAAGASYHDACLETIETFIREYTNNHHDEIIDYVDGFAACTGKWNFINSLLIVAAVFLVSIWMVGILSMVNSINTSVLNRRGELTMLRSIGMTRRQLMGSVFLESLLFAAAASIIGIAIGVLNFCYVLDYVTQTGFKLNITTTFCFTAGVALLTLILNLVIAMLSAVPAVKNLKTI